MSNCHVVKRSDPHAENHLGEQVIIKMFVETIINIVQVLANWKAKIGRFSGRRVSKSQAVALFVDPGSDNRLV